MEEVAPHRLKENRKPSRRAAAGKDDAGEVKWGSGGVREWRSCEGSDHRVDERSKAASCEDMPHRYRHLPVAALKALHTGERGTLEVLFKRRSYRVRLLRRQEAKLKLLLVVDEVSRPLPGGICY